MKCNTGVAFGAIRMGPWTAHPGSDAGPPENGEYVPTGGLISAGGREQSRRLRPDRHRLTIFSELIIVLIALLFY
jgi:hypothetical protein